MLTVADLWKSFRSDARQHRDVQAVRGVSFDVAAGSFFTILGPSGCGKSTVLRCLAGLERPDAGEIRIDGEVVYSASQGRVVPAASRPIGMVFQSYAIWPHLRVFDNAAYPLLHGRRRTPRSEVKLRVMDMLERVGLSDYAHSWATQLSGGQQQRLALARALLCEPKVLLLDEPLSNLDARLRTSLRAELKGFQRSFGVTTVYVTHDQSEALALSDSIAVMNEGRIQQLGSAEAIYDQPASPFVANFIGRANLVRATLTGGAASAVTSFGEIKLNRPSIAPRDGQICIRPEHVRLHLTPANGQANIFAGRIASSDFLGDHRECQVQIGADVLYASAPGSASVAPGQEVWLELPPDRISFFGAAD